MPKTPGLAPAGRLDAIVVVIVLSLLTACASWPARDDRPDTVELLQNGLPVAAAALAAGQLDVARRLYVSLAEQFENAPAPFLGLGYVDFQGGGHAAAEKHFLQAVERAVDAPAIQAEALLGAGRAALVRGRKITARRHFRDARPVARDTPSEPWIDNGLAVIATLRAEYELAEAYYGDALRNSSGHPRIAANYVRMLVAAGRLDEAARTYREHPPTWWAEGDGPALSRLIDESRRDLRRQTLENAAAGTGDAPADASATRIGAGTAKSGRGVPPAVPSDSTSSPATPAGPESGSPPGLLVPRLALRLDGVSPTAASSDAAASLAREAAAADPSRLILGHHRGLRPDATTRAADGTAPTLASDAEMPQSGASVPVVEPSASGPDPARVPPAPPAAPGPARVSPVSDDEAPVVKVLDSSDPPMLALILGQSRRLHLDRDASSVLVASPEIADVRLLAPDVLYVIGKGVGRTSVAVLDDEERVDEWIVSVALDLEPLREVLARESGLDEVRARRLTRGVALTGEVASAEAADRALRLAAGALPEGVPVENDLSIAAPQQVNLEVQIAEVQRVVTEDLGVNWDTFGINNATRFGFRIGRFPLTNPDGGPGAGQFPPGLFDGNTASSIFFGTEGERGQFRAMIDALASAGLANVLARPNITAVSGESASFFSGGEFPLPTGFDNGVLVFDYKKYGVLLDFVPTVVDTGRIVLTVRPEVSEPSLNESVSVIQGVNVPVINVRRAETTVEVADGESIVIAGLFRNRSNTVETGLPVAKDLPLLGALFGHTSARSEELELIVVVTARLVRAHAESGNAAERPATLQADGYHY